MKKSLDAFFRKSFSASNFKKTLTNALARIAVLKKQHQERWSQARSDVVELLNLDNHESAILRVDHVIREQNLLEALMIIKGHCILLMERIDLIKSSIECPEELKESIASVIHAASRYGQLPELQKISRILTKKYGKDLVNYANELHNNCNPKIAKKLQTRRASLRTRLKVLKQIAAEHRITLKLEGENPEVTQEKELPEEKAKCVSLSANLRARNRYKDINQAAQAAFELATQAAAAAKVVAELLPDKDSSDDSHHQEEHLAKHDENESLKELNLGQEEAGQQKIDHFEASFRNLSIQMPNESFRSESNEAGPSNTKASGFTFESVADIDKQMNFKILGQNKTVNEEESKTRPWQKQQEWDTEKKFSLFMNEFLGFNSSDAGKDESNSDENTNERGDHRTTEGSSRGRRPISVRTRRTIDNNSSRGKRAAYIRP